MSVTRTLLLPFAGAALFAAAGAAHAGPVYNNTIDAPGNSTVTQNDRGGRVTSIDTTYDSGSQTFDWSYTVSDDNDGFWLVVSPGPNPKSRADELAILFGDLGDANDPNDNRLTAYVYNGQNANSIDSLTNPGTLLASFDNALTSTDHGNNTQTVSFSIDATDINAAFAGTGTGVAFGSKLGIWFHPLAGSSFTYNTNPDANGNLGIASFTPGATGWYDVGGKDAVATVPEPSALYLSGVGLLAFGLSRIVTTRRRSAGARSMRPTGAALAI